MLVQKPFNNYPPSTFHLMRKNHPLQLPQCLLPCYAPLPTSNFHLMLIVGLLLLQHQHAPLLLRRPANTIWTTQTAACLPSLSCPAAA